MRGPMDLNINDECGLLIQGHDGTPVIMMTYHPPYYQPLIEKYGFTKAKDLYAYYVDIARFGEHAENLPERIHRVAAIARDRYGVTIRPVDMSNLDHEVELLMPIHRQAWDENWGALPMSGCRVQLPQRSSGPGPGPRPLLPGLSRWPAGRRLYLPARPQSGRPSYERAALSLWLG